MTRQIKINIEEDEFNELEKIKIRKGWSWEFLIKTAITNEGKKK